NMMHMVPKGEDELADMMFTAMKWEGPIAVRYPRGIGPGTPVKDVPALIPIGKAELLQHGDNDRVAIFALGAMVPMAEEIALKLPIIVVSERRPNGRFSCSPLDGGVLSVRIRHNGTDEVRAPVTG